MSGRRLSFVLRGLPALACAGLMLLGFVCGTLGIEPEVPQDGGSSPAVGQAGRRDSKSLKPRLSRLVAGWKGTVLPGPPGPWRLEISCGDKPVDATVNMSFRQDSTQSTEISQRVALVPGRVARVEFAAAAAERDAEIGFVLRDSSNRVLDGAKADANSFGSGRFSYDLPYTHFTSAVLFVGRRINPPAETENRGYTPRDESIKEYVRSRCLFKTIESADLPIDAASYGGVDAVVLDQADLLALDPARLSALREYLATGGNVSLVTSIVGDGWQLLAGLAPLSDSGTRMVGVPTPVVLAQASPMSGTRLAALMANGAPANAGVDPSAAADAQVLVRSAELTTLGRDEGWVVWPAAGPVLARGPIGLGQLTLWLVSPTLLGASVELAEREAVWNAALLAAGVAPADVRRPIEERSWYTERGEAPALTSVRSELMGIMPKLTLSHTMAWIFGGVMLALALLVGVGDSKVHRRDKRPRAYFTCAAWIVIACVLAVVLPRVLGSKAAFSLRVSEMEQVCNPSAPLARTVTAHAIMADQATEWAPPVTGSFCQGFDLLEPQFARNSERFALPTIEMATVASASGMVTRPIAPLSVRRSAIHCLLETQTGKPTFTAATTTDVQGRPIVRLAGLRPGDQIIWAGLAHSAAVVQAEDATADAAGTVTLLVTLPDSAAGAGVASAASANKAGPERLLTVDPAQTSRAAQLARAAGGRYIIVRFRVRSPAAGVDSSVNVDEAVVTLHVPVTSWPEAVALSLARGAKAILSSEQSALLEWKARPPVGDGSAVGNAPSAIEPALRTNRAAPGGGVKPAKSAVPGPAAMPTSPAPSSPAEVPSPAEPLNIPGTVPERADAPPKSSEEIQPEGSSSPSAVQRNDRLLSSDCTRDGAEEYTP